MAREYVDGNWRVSARIDSTPAGSLVKAERYDEQQRKLCERTIWIWSDGHTVDASIDRLGYIIDAQGVRLDR